MNRHLFSAPGRFSKVLLVSNMFLYVFVKDSSRNVVPSDFSVVRLPADLFKPRESLSQTFLADPHLGIEWLGETPPKFISSSQFFSMPFCP